MHSLEASMGIEKEWQRLLVDRVEGREIPPFHEEDVTSTGTTPNQRAVGRALWFLDSHMAKRTAEQGKSIDFLIDLYEEQEEYGHMARKPRNVGFAPNEMFIPGNHYHIWLNAMAAVLYFATEWGFADKPAGSRERRLYDLAARWFLFHTAANAACATPEGIIVAAGARAMQKGGPTAPVRDAVFQVIRGLPLTGKSAKKGWWKRDQVGTMGAALVREMCERGDASMKRAREATVPADLPVMFDPVEIERWPDGHIVKAPQMRATKAVRFAWADYRTGERGFEGTEPPVFDGEPERITIARAPLSPLPGPGIEPVEEGEPEEDEG
jgi:hypothetical protein